MTDFRLSLFNFSLFPKLLSVFRLLQLLIIILCVLSLLFQNGTAFLLSFNYKNFACLYWYLNLCCCFFILFPLYLIDNILSLRRQVLFCNLPICIDVIWLIFEVFHFGHYFLFYYWGKIVDWNSVLPCSLLYDFIYLVYFFELFLIISFPLHFLRSFSFLVNLLRFFKDISLNFILGPQFLFKSQALCLCKSLYLFLHYFFDKQTDEIIIFFVWL